MNTRRRIPAPATTRARSCSKLHPFDFGSYGVFLSREITVATGSSAARQIGRNVRNALLAGDFEAAAVPIVGPVLETLDTVGDEAVRRNLARRVVWRMIDALAERRTL